MRFCMISRHQGIGWSWEYRWERCRPWVSMWRSWTDFSCRSLLRLDFELSWIELLELSSQAKEYKNIVFTVWDLGGQTRTRQIWQHYYQLLGSQFCNILHSEIESYEQVQHHVWVVYGCLGNLCRAKEHRWAHLRLALSNGTPMPAMLPYPLMHVTDAQKSEVIDSSDRDRIDEAHEELMKMLQKDEMKDWRYLGCIGETTIEVNFAWTEFLVCQGKWMLQGGSKEQFLCRMQCCLWWQISKTSRMLWVLRWGQKIYSRELGKAILAVILLNCPVKKLRSWCKSWAWTAWVSTEGNGSCRRAFHAFSATGHTVFNWLPGIHDSKIWPLHPQSCPQETCATVGDGLHEARKLWEAQNGGEMKCAWIDLMLSRCTDRAWIGLPKPSLTRADALPRLLMELSPLADSNPSHPFLYQRIKLSSRSSWCLFISAASWHVRKSMCHLSHPVSPTEPARGAVEVKHVETLAYSILQPYLLNFSPKRHRANVGLVLRCHEANANRPMHSRQKSCQKWKVSFASFASFYVMEK